MSTTNEWRDALLDLRNAVDRCESNSLFGKVSESAAYREAKALLARPEKSSTNFCCWEDCDQEAEYCVGHLEQEKAIAVEEMRRKDAAAAARLEPFALSEEAPRIPNEVLRNG